MDDDADQPVTDWIHQLQSSDAAVRELAAHRLWAYYAWRLAHSARRHLSPHLRGRVEGDEIANSAFLGFLLRQRQGHFTLNSRHDLTSLLMRFVKFKSLETARYHERLKRAASRQGDLEGLMNLAAATPSPVEEAIFAEEKQRLIDGLPPKLKDVAVRALADESVGTIAAALGCSTRTVERKLDLIELRWRQMFDAERGPGGPDAPTT